MILVDANLLVYAAIPEMAQHASAREWLDERLNGTARVALPWPSLLAFLRIVTNRRLFERAVPMRDAWRTVQSWLGQPPVWQPQPTERHAEILGALLAHATYSRLVTDAHLAALAIEHGLVLCSADGDFARFEGLRWENPVAAT